jgi:hypothetical protein
MADIKQAAIWAAQGNAVKRSTWSINPRDDDFHKPFMMHRSDRRMMQPDRTQTQWYEGSLTVDDLLADDWIITE